MVQPSIRVYFEPEIHEYFEARRKRLKLSQTEFYKNLIMNSHMSQSLDEVHSNLEQVLRNLSELKPGDSGGGALPVEVMRSIFFIEALLTISMNRPEVIKQAHAKADQSLNQIKGE